MGRGLREEKVLLVLFDHQWEHKMPSECNGNKDSVLDTKLSSPFISFVFTSSKKSRGGTGTALRKPEILRRC